MDSDTSYTAAGELLKALAAPLRIGIVTELAAGPRCVHELVDALGAPQPLISQHLRVLRGANVVHGPRRGREIAYSLTDDHIARNWDHQIYAWNKDGSVIFRKYLLDSVWSSPVVADIDRNGVAWVALASGHLGSFDRRKCTGPLNGPTATGQHCPEGWTFHAEPLPQFRGLSESGSAEASYYTWVDQQDAFGLGKNTPINTGNLSEGLLALKDGKWVA